MAELFSLSIERHCLASLVNHSQKYPDIVSFIKEDTFFHPVHRIIFRVISQYLNNKEKLNTALIANKIKSLGITSFEELDIEKYIQSFSAIKTPSEAFKSFFDEIALLKVKRDLMSLSKDIANSVSANNDTTIAGLIRSVDDIYANGINRSIFHTDGPINIAQGLDAFVEGIAENPPDPHRHMFGPFRTINNLLGSLHRPGNITCIGARSGVAKTTLSLFYNLHLALTYKVPILWCDFSEMSADELRLRLAACLTGGQIPLYAIEHGTWSSNPKQRDLIKSVWPKIKDLQIHYVDIGRMSETDLFSYVRRYKLNHVGRDNPFIWVLDYLKPFDCSNYDAPEWKQMGHFIQHVKSFLPEINTSLWTALQLNRSGITTGKSSAQVDDSEAAFSVSDRIIQQCSHGFVIRKKLNEELEREQNKYGNMIMKWVKCRHLGQNPQRAIDRVEMPDKKQKENYVNLLSRSFYFEDVGDLVDQVASENNIVTMQDDQDDGSLPL